MKNIIQKTIAFLFCILFLGISFGSVVAVEISADMQNSSNYQEYSILGKNSIIHVDCNNTEGPWDGSPEYPFRRITEGVYYANSKDTVYVHNGAYYESVTIDKSLNLVGEDKEATSILVQNTLQAIKIDSDDVSIQNLTIKNDYDDYSYSIEINDCSDILIRNNIIADNYAGIHVEDSQFITIQNNEFYYSSVSVKSFSSDHVELSNNYIHCRSRGILFSKSTNSLISENIIEGNGEGIELSWKQSVTIRDNTFLNNDRNVELVFQETEEYLTSDIQFQNNYYDKPRYLPYVIFGWIGVLYYLFPRPAILIEWHPATQPPTQTTLPMQEQLIKNSIIHVDDDNIEGPWDGSSDHPYMYIQNALDHSNPYDTIYIHDGLYNETLSITVDNISLVGEAPKNTQLTNDGQTKNIMNVEADDVVIQNLTLTQSTNHALYLHNNQHTTIQHCIIHHNNERGIAFNNSQYNFVADNIIYNNTRGVSGWNHSDNNIVYQNKIANHSNFGIRIYESDKWLVSDNILTDTYYNSSGYLCGDGISLRHSNNNTITNNTLKNISYSAFEIGDSNNNLINSNEIDNARFYSLYMYRSHNNEIKQNKISYCNANNIQIDGCNFNTITENTIQDNRIIGWIDTSEGNTISRNNFINYTRPPTFFVLKMSEINYWRANYWDDWPLRLPRPIFGSILISPNSYREMIWINFDWHPATQPYNYQ